LPSFELAGTLSTEVLLRGTQRKHYSAPDKGAIRRLHLLENKPVADPCDPFGIQPNRFYRGQRESFENGAAAFTANGKPSLNR
jgi:hypothetical protein